MGTRGAWMSVLPPPPDTCESCGAVRQLDVIEMRPRPLPLGFRIYTQGSASDG